MAQAQGAPHAPIIINGDAELCDTDQGGIDAEDGIINCDTADGSAEAPYLIEGFSIQVINCPAAGTTCGPPPCAASTVPAALSICNTDRHIVVRGLAIRNEESVRATGTDQVYASGITIAGASNVVLEGTTVRAAANALVVTSATGGDATVRNPRGIIVRGGLYESLTSDPGGQAAAREARIISVQNADIAFEGVTIDGSLRSVAIESVSGHGPSEAAHTFRMEASTVRDAHEDGLILEAYTAIIRDSHFILNGDTPLTTIEGTSFGNGNLELKSGNVEVANNTFDSIGIAVEARSSTIRLQRNTFASSSVNAGAGRTAPAALFQESGHCSTILFSYNDLTDHRVVNDDVVCAVIAAYNYWGSAAGPTTDQVGGQGSVIADEFLVLPVEDLPVVKVVAPSPGTEVHGRVLIVGTASQNEAPSALTRIEATESEDDWETNFTTIGVSPWEFSLDTSGHGLGDLNLWARACWAGGCGLPSKLTLRVVERPLPPIALLEARPKVGFMGDEILLDAALSYSPQGRPLASFRFDPGNGGKTDWRPEPEYVVRYAAPGEYPASVEVMDLAGLTSTNLPQIVIRIRGTDADAGAGNPLPGPSPALLALAFGLGVLGRRR